MFLLIGSNNFIKPELTYNAAAVVTKIAFCPGTRYRIPGHGPGITIIITLDTFNFLCFVQVSDKLYLPWEMYYKGGENALL